MENIKIAIEVILVIMGFFFIAFNSYLKKKGENIATKKDIGIITNEIEKVKNEISYQNQKKLNFYFEKKKNLMDFFDNYFIWTENSINIAGSLLSHSNNEKVLRDLISQLKENQTKVFTNFSRIFLFNHSSELNNTTNKIYNETLKSHNLTMAVLIDLEHLAINYQKLIKRSKSISTKSEENGFISDLDELKKKRDSKFENYILEFNKVNEETKRNKLLLIKTLKKELKLENA